MTVHAKMLPVAMEQPGFVSVYGGPILKSTWLYFGARFSSRAQMNAWYHHRGHQGVIKMAYAKWWSAVYIRKWETPTQRATPATRLMCETRVHAGMPLDGRQTSMIERLCAGLTSAGCSPFETLTGEYEPQPYQLVGPLEIAPGSDQVIYSLITHWASDARLAAWLQSENYASFRSLGPVTSETFVAAEETDERNFLRTDKLQRQWTLEDNR